MAKLSLESGSGNAHSSNCFSLLWILLLDLLTEATLSKLLFCWIDGPFLPLGHLNGLFLLSAWHTQPPSKHLTLQTIALFSKSREEGGSSWNLPEQCRAIMRTENLVLLYDSHYHHKRTGWDFWNSRDMQRDCGFAYLLREVSRSLDYIWVQYIAEDDLEFLICLPLLSKFCEHKCAPPYPTYVSHVHSIQCWQLSSQDNSCSVLQRRIWLRKCGNSLFLLHNIFIWC